MTEKVAQRGRPVKYAGTLAIYIVSLVRLYGQSGAFNILNADKSSAKSKKFLAMRNLEMVPKALGISKPTLQKLAANAKKPVVLSRGRPSFKKVAKFDAVVASFGSKKAAPATEVPQADAA